MSQQFISINAQTTGTGTAVPTETCQNAKQIMWYIIWPAGVTAGAVVIETAQADDYAGTWAPLDSADLAVNASAGSCSMGTFPGLLPSIRARVTTPVSGGGAPSVTVIFVLFGDL